MIDDRLQIDLVNPTTWTGDFGVPHDGFRKDLFIDGSYTTAIDEEPTDYSDDLALKPKDLAGNMYLKTTSPNYAPHPAFPTRKFEYSDGTVTWYRPELPWSWMGKGSVFGSMKMSREMSVLVVLAIIALALYLLTRVKM
jgi:hypothetical protein